MHKPTDLLDQLSQAAREQALDEKKRLDSRWDRLAAGQLSEDEHDELLGLADVSGEAYEAYQAFKPLGPAFEKRVAAAILARQQAEAEERLAPPDTEEKIAALPVPVPPAGRRGRYFGGAAVALLSMVVAFIAFRVQQIPIYNLADLQGFSKNRGAAAAGDEKIPAYADGDPLELVAEATVEPGSKLDARLFVASGGEPLRQTAVVPEIGEDGSEVRFAATLGRELKLPLGVSNLVVVIARPGEFPDRETIEKAVSSGGRPDKYWQVLVQQIEMETLP
jgi:hypothetical protein